MKNTKVTVAYDCYAQAYIYIAKESIFGREYNDLIDLIEAKSVKRYLKKHFPNAEVTYTDR